MGRDEVRASVSSKGCVSVHTQLRIGDGFSCSKASQVDILSVCPCLPSKTMWKLLYEAMVKKQLCYIVTLEEGTKLFKFSPRNKVISSETLPYSRTNTPSSPPAQIMQGWDTCCEFKLSSLHHRHIQTQPWFVGGEGAGGEGMHGDWSSIKETITSATPAPHLTPQGKLASARLVYPRKKVSILATGYFHVES